MVKLHPMSSIEFSAYLAWAIPEHAREKVASGQWEEAESTKLSENAYLSLLPQGLQTPGHHLLTIKLEHTDSMLGAIWLHVQDRAKNRIAYVYDTFIEEAYQGKGYATQAFKALEILAREMDLGGIALHVFGHNHRARTLYDKLGYRATNIQMYKSLDSDSPV